MTDTLKKSKFNYYVFNNNGDLLLYNFFSGLSSLSRIAKEDVNAFSEFILKKEIIPHTTADKYKGLIPTGHAGIIWTSSTIVESLSNGVTTGPNDWNTSKTSCYGISVKGTTVDEDNEASNWCYRQLGKPYNYNYFNVSTRKKFYCSQLVWAAFKDNYGIDLDTSDFGDAVHPMELVNSSKTYTIYKK